ncbi:hypothetical protein RvY_10406-2 [Ramazzottius varieornatus]|nr:hypothetical protein RvY_10406-2 [Ramazzottius varieornatus]
MKDIRGQTAKKQRLSHRKIPNTSGQGTKRIRSAGKAARTSAKKHSAPAKRKRSQAAKDMHNTGSDSEDEASVADKKQRMNIPYNGKNGGSGRPVGKKPDATPDAESDDSEKAEDGDDWWEVDSEVDHQKLIALDKTVNLDGAARNPEAIATLETGQDDATVLLGPW